MLAHMGKTCLPSRRNGVLLYATLRINPSCEPLVQPTSPPISLHDNFFTRTCSDYHPFNDLIHQGTNNLFCADWLWQCQNNNPAAKLSASQAQHRRNERERAEYASIMS